MTAERFIPFLRWLSPHQRSTGFGSMDLRLPLSAVGAAVLILLSLSGCAINTPVLDNAFCRLYQRLPDPSDAVNLKLRANKVAILTNEQTWVTECGRKEFGGPR